MPKRIKMPEPPKTQIKRAGLAMESIVKGIGLIWKNEVLKKMKVDKFQDVALSTDMQKKFDKLAKVAVQKIKQKYSSRKIDKLTRDLLTQVDKRTIALSRDRLIKEAFGISFDKTKVPKSLTKELFKGTEERISNIASSAVKSYSESSLTALRTGKNLEEVLKRFDGDIAVRKDQARTNARTQIANFNSQNNAARATALGVKKAEWSTTMDGRERPSHADRDGKTFDLDKGLYSAIDGLHILPGDEPNCRCDMFMILDD